MASTSSLGASTSTNSSEAQQFYHEFNNKVEGTSSCTDEHNVEIADNTLNRSSIQTRIGKEYRRITRNQCTDH